MEVFSLARAFITAFPTFRRAFTGKKLILRALQTKSGILESPQQSPRQQKVLCHSRRNVFMPSYQRALQLSS